MKFHDFLYSDSSRNAISALGAGASGRFVAYPLDTIKVRLQTQSILNSSNIMFKGPLDCLISTIRFEGFFALYKGFQSPLLASLFETTLTFTSFEEIKKRFKVYHFNKDPTLTSWKLNSNLDIACNFFSGSSTGGLLACILAPFELVKSRLQIQRQGSSNLGIKYKGMFDCAIKTYKEKGIVNGLYRGFLCYFIREFVGNGFWFSSYYFMTNKLIPLNGTRKDIPGWQLVICGGLSGALYWIIPFPFDTIKSRMQVSGDKLKPIVQKLMKEGFKSFYKGVGITVIRALPSNGITFTVYECLSGIIESWQHKKKHNTSLY